MHQTGSPVVFKRANFAERVGSETGYKGQRNSENQELPSKTAGPHERAYPGAQTNKQAKGVCKHKGYICLHRQGRARPTLPANLVVPVFR